MEDAHSAIIGIPDIGENVSWFAVFDGHAGSRVSAHCSGDFLSPVIFMRSLAFRGFSGFSNFGDYFGSVTT